MKKLLSRMLCIALVVYIVPISVTDAIAFDSQRKGFLLNAEVGYAPLVRWTVKDYPVKENEKSFQFGGSIGYGLDNRNVLCFRYEFARYTADYFDFDFVPEEYQDVILDRFNLAWYHFLRDQSPSLYFMFGGGYLRHETSIPGFDSEGFNFLGGAGYQFMRNFSLSVVAQPGFSSNRDSLDFTHFQINLEATAWVY